MKILFFPSDRGGGFGHISRCLNLAQEAKDRGYSCAFLLGDIKYGRQVGSQFPVFIVKPPRSTSRKILGVLMKIMPQRHRSTSLYLGISGLDYQVVRDGLVTQKNIEHYLSKYEGVVKTFKPDILIGDTNLLAWILARKVGIPIVQVVRYASHPKTARLIWWENETNGMTPPNTGLLFNPVLNALGLNSIERAEHLLQGDLYIVPSIPELEPIPQDEKTIHVGHLSVPEINEEVPSWVRDINADIPLIYMTIGGGAGPVGNRLCFQTPISAFADKPVQVVISTSTKYNVRDFPRLPSNIRVFQWVPGKLLISRADLIIFHGGYGTMMEILACGKPSLIIPFQTEQEGNGRRLEQLGCGRVTHWSKQAFQRVEGKWEYGRFTYLVQNRFDLTSDELSREVTEMLSKKIYRDHAQILQYKVNNLGGAQRALDVVEKLFK